VNSVPNVFSIAGSDPGGGAGVQMDLKTFAAFGVYGCAAPAVLTVQNTVGVSRVLSLPANFLRAQLDAVFSDIRIDAVKIGMLGSGEAVRVVAGVLRRHRPPFVVLDPVFRSSTGAALADADVLEALRHELLPLVSLVTPNAHEAGILLKEAPPRSLPEARAAAGKLVARGIAAALVKGGHIADTHLSTDVLHNGQELHTLSVPRVAVAGAHGTGCALSSAIASLLALGHDLHTACAQGQQFVANAIRAGAQLQVGRGALPVHPTASARAVPE
jgi:hydroxymethylpyrimidine/phosphomethylpyrimidine kinase